MVDRTSGDVPLTDELIDRLAIEAEWGYPAGSLRECRPYLCPESGDVECCERHSGFKHCCYFPENHGPVTCICPRPGDPPPLVRWSCLVHDGALNPDGTWAQP